MVISESVMSSSATAWATVLQEEWWRRQLGRGVCVREEREIGKIFCSFIDPITSPYYL